MLAVAVVFVLLMACANVANLLLARSASRQREMAVRAALGAAPRRIAVQLIVESCVLAAFGGAIGLLLAVWGIDALVALHTEHLPRAAEVRPDWHVAAFTLVLALATGLTFGVVPALYGARTAPSEVLKEGGRGTSGSKTGAARRVLLVAQVALAVVLLGGAGLLLRSLHALAELAPGEAPGSVLTARLRLPPVKYADDTQRTAFFDDLRGRLAHAPGVRSVSVAWLLPLTPNHIEINFSVEGEPEAPGTAAPQAEYSEVGPGFFETMGLPILTGRSIGEEDRAGTPFVAVVSQRFARRFYPQGAIGKRFQLHVNDDPWVTIVGVVGDVRTSALDREPNPMMYLSSEQNPEQMMYVVARTTGDARALLPVITREVRALDADLPVADVATVADLVANSLDTRNFALRLFGVFAAVALLIGAVGIYGLTSYSVVQRTREIGIRVALGATPADVVGSILRYALTLTGIGLAVGLAATLALGRSIRALVYGVPLHDPLTLATVTCVLLGAAFFAAFIPARRAARVVPTVALRIE
jgi:predicted permease